MDRPEVTHVETRWNENGLRMTDIRPLEELPALVWKIQQDGGQIVGVSPFETRRV